MINLSNLFLRAALVFLGTGVSMGIFMSLSQDFTVRPVHVHVNLLGWVGFFLYASFYRFFPHTAGTRLSWTHFWTAVIGLPAMMVGLTLVVFGHMDLGLPLLLGGEFVTVISVALFIYIGFMATKADLVQTHRESFVPAE
ncbi:hypothetical protein [Microvirga sp. VF16]|uniref:hypothetical protein n=1 Tax=Microvirga sp. VF16 TaxID=2807101 RepID=UPI00193CD7FC|nr:hypothetical protein [Microvirga sp. VF16]QRM29949.1 hypothetical protein JO965_02725 [Microvirga sp. VF16]